MDKKHIRFRKSFNYDNDDDDDDDGEYCRAGDNSRVQGLKIANGEDNKGGDDKDLVDGHDQGQVYHFLILLKRS
ncbi:hypothetical protein G9C98_000728 [Cotesia typhae]|uniref:Uncharacterized protein n=1 Tax=Cotesia typhae TaxID=2053667 RepID=A0A8J5VB65_9HYME|nr:hypothetical protein G9C98_000728 [Cotesia typhae]